MTYSTVKGVIVQNILNGFYNGCGIASSLENMEATVVSEVGEASQQGISTATTTKINK